MPVLRDDPIVRRAPVDWILAKMTDLSELPAALHLGCAATLGAVAIRGRVTPLLYPSLARPHHSQDHAAFS